MISASYDPLSNSIVGTAMVTDRVSDAGTCALAISQGEQTISVSNPGMADATVTYCANLAVVLPEGATGIWTAQVTYDEVGFHGETESLVTLP